MLLAELIREQVLRRTFQEIPHAVEVVVDDVERPREDLTVVRALVWVEADSQKGILIGHGGRMIKTIGTAARRELTRALRLFAIFRHALRRVLPPIAPHQVIIEVIFSQIACRQPALDLLHRQKLSFVPEILRHRGQRFFFRLQLQFVGALLAGASLEQFTPGRLQLS